MAHRPAREPILTAFHLRVETPRLFGAIRALLDDSRLTFRRWGDCSVFPLMRSGDREKGFESPCDIPWWRAPAPLLPNLLAVVSVSSLNPAGISSSSYVFSLLITQGRGLPESGRQEDESERLVESQR